MPLTYYMPSTHQSYSQSKGTYVSATAPQAYPYYTYYNRQSMSPNRTDSSRTGATFSSSSSSLSSLSSRSPPRDSVEVAERMATHMSYAVDPTCFDHTMARQAQASGTLNAKNRELMELQALAQRRLAAARTNFADGLRAARDVQRELAWAQQSVTALNQRAAMKYPAQYQAAVARYPPLIED
ncbi:hypothetical protein ANO11243_033260 [Dothideomycetidae sp. 11243]|nr:hypothetical protein ANO11243_033260 [fungal sp. No.11243]